ncbi:MAG: hypothetical protein NTV34_06545, partial [Proteobacteria bacterium]|nr:hypothetical protein [Pseudomonadota bacterium]
EASLVMNILWIYRVGISSSNLVRRLKQNFRIGVCGDSGSGKSTATDVLVDLFGKKNTLVVAGDDLHKWERGDSNWQKFTHLDPKSNRLHVDVDHAEKLMTGQMVSRSNYDHVTGMFTPACSIESNRVMIFQGLHTFFLPRMRNLLHLKVFFDPDRNLRYTWKIHRDQKKRGYSKEQVLEQLAKREPDAVKYIESQRLHADIVVRYLPVQPDLSLEAMLVMASVPIKIQLQLTADLDVENLVAALVSSESLSCEYWYDTSLGKVVLECVGDISVDRVRAIAPKLATLYEEIIGTDPCWQGGYSGVLQLIVLQYMTYFYSHSSQGMRT